MKKPVNWMIVLAAALILNGLVGNAMADDRLYTSSSFRIPGSRIETPAEEPATEEDYGDISSAEIMPAEGITSDDGEDELTANLEGVSSAAEEELAVAEDKPAVEPEKTEEPAESISEQEKAKETTNEPKEEASEPEQAGETMNEASDDALETEQATEIMDDSAESALEPEKAEETTDKPDESMEYSDEAADDEDEQSELAGEKELPETETKDQTEPEERQVLIRSSRRENVTGGDIIELTSELIGFEGLDVHYQWQVDRNDGKGWVDAEEGNRWKYTFVADRNTVMYNWRLIVTIDE